MTRILGTDNLLTTNLVFKLIDYTDGKNRLLKMVIILTVESIERKL